MRFACLLTCIVMPFLVRPQSTRPPRSTDSLAKYSYQLITNCTNDTVHLNATGFFVRIDEKIYLVTCFHAVSGCSMSPVNPSYRKDTIKSLDIVYEQSKGIIESKNIPLPQYTNAPCYSFADSPDIVMINVSDSFSNIRINSIENMLPPYGTRDNLIKGTKVVGYGYPKEQMDTLTHPKKYTTKPIGFSRHVCDLPIDEDVKGHPRHPLINFAIKPGLSYGVSGAPIFFVAKDSTRRSFILFVGVQSESFKDPDIEYPVASIIVKSSQLLKMIDQRRQ